MTRREDGAFHGSKRSVVVRSNRRMAEGFEKFASVVHVYEGATEAQIRENGLVVFNLLKGFGDVELAATFDLEELLDTFTPKHDAA